MQDPFFFVSALLVFIACCLGLSKCVVMPNFDNRTATNTFFFSVLINFVIPCGMPEGSIVVCVLCRLLPWFRLECFKENVYEEAGGRLGKYTRPTVMLLLCVACL